MNNPSGIKNITIQFSPSQINPDVVKYNITSCTGKFTPTKHVKFSGNSLITSSCILISKRSETQGVCNAKYLENTQRIMLNFAQINGCEYSYTCRKGNVEITVFDDTDFIKDNYKYAGC